jgi:hypothetical protein
VTFKMVVSEDEMEAAQGEELEGAALAWLNGGGDVILEGGGAVSREARRRSGRGGGVGWFTLG